MLHAANLAKGASSPQLHRGGSRRVLLSNIYPLLGSCPVDPNHPRHNGLAPSS
jgi:hypothetical protein